MAKITILRPTRAYRTWRRQSRRVRPATAEVDTHAERARVRTYGDAELSEDERFVNAAILNGLIGGDDGAI